MNFIFDFLPKSNGAQNYINDIKSRFDWNIFIVGSYSWYVLRRDSISVRSEVRVCLRRYYYLTHPSTHLSHIPKIAFHISEQKCAHVCSKSCIVGYRGTTTKYIYNTYALQDLWDCSAIVFHRDTWIWHFTLFKLGVVKAYAFGMLLIIRVSPTYKFKPVIILIGLLEF